MSVVLSGDEGEERGEEEVGNDTGSEEEDSWRATETHQDAASVFPVCVDRETRKAYVLMGGMCLCCKPKDEKKPESNVVHLSNGNTRPRLVRCQFHGWVDVGENMKEAAAREAQEEGLGILGSKESILSLLSKPSTHQHLLISATNQLEHEEKIDEEEVKRRQGYFQRSGIYMISLGYLDKSQREELTTEFSLRRQNSASEIMHFGMQEMCDVRFVCLGDLRQAVLSKSENDFSKVEGMGEGEWLRAMMRRRLADKETWDRLSLLIDEGALPCEGQWYMANPTSSTSATASAVATTPTAAVTATTTTTAAKSATVNLDAREVRIEPMSLAELLRGLPARKQLCRHWHHHASCETDSCPFSHPPHKNNSKATRVKGKGLGGNNVGGDQRNHDQEGKDNKRTPHSSNVPELEDSEPVIEVEQYKETGFSGRGGRRASTKRDDACNEPAKRPGDVREQKEPKIKESPSKESSSRQWRASPTSAQSEEVFVNDARTTRGGRGGGRGGRGGSETSPQYRDNREEPVPRTHNKTSERGSRGRRERGTNRGGYGGPEGRMGSNHKPSHSNETANDNAQNQGEASDSRVRSDSHQPSNRSETGTERGSGSKGRGDGSRGTARGGLDMDEWFRLRQA